MKVLKDTEEQQERVETPAEETDRIVQEVTDREMTAEEKAKEEEKLREEVEAFKANPENQIKARDLAKQILAINGQKWFSLRNFAKKVKEPELQLFQKLKLLELFGLLVSKVWRSSTKFHRGERVFRVVIDNGQQIQAHLDEIKEMENSIKWHRERIQELQTVKS